MYTHMVCVYVLKDFVYHLGSQSLCDFKMSDAALALT